MVGREACGNSAPYDDAQSHAEKTQECLFRGLSREALFKAMLYKYIVNSLWISFIVKKP